MKHVMVSLLLLPMGLCAQRPDSTIRAKHTPKVVIALSFETQTYTPEKWTESNTFDMTYKFSSGMFTTIAVTKNISAMIGIHSWKNTVEKYSLNSRSFAQTGLHGAAGVVFNKKIDNGTLSIGLAVAKFSYVVAGTPRWYDNRKFQDFSKLVIDTVPGIRGIYYNAPYLFTSWKKRGARQNIELELNLLIPGKWPQVISSWQPRGSLVHLIRTKAIYDMKRYSFKVDVQIPTITKSRVASYGAINFSNMTGKVEVGRSIPFDRGKVKVLLGYERDWHALNYPHLLPKDMKGTWAAFFFGLRAESVLMKFKKQNKR